MNLCSRQSADGDLEHAVGAERKKRERIGARVRPLTGEPPY
jgi:hypothetical protein